MMTEQPATPTEPALVRPMPLLGRGIHWSDIVTEIDRDNAERQPAGPDPLVEARQRLGIAPGGGSPTPSLGETGSSLGDQPSATGDASMLGIAFAHLDATWPKPPSATELRAMADDLNAHGGPDETFVAGLLQTAAGGSEGGDAPRPRWRRALDRARRWGK